MTAQAGKSCIYERGDGSRCDFEIDGEGDFCYWHDPDAPKNGDNVKSDLEGFVRDGISLEGFELRFSRLEGARLTVPDGVNLRRANLFHARMQGAHMFHIDLRGSDLMKADLSGANINLGRMNEANLLAANLTGTSMAGTEWGTVVPQESRGNVAASNGDNGQARELFQEAREVYRNLRRALDAGGHRETAGHFFIREMTMKRRLMPLWSLDRLWSKLVHLFCAYGESPPRVIGASISVVLLFAVFYFVYGVNSSGDILGYEAGASFWTNFQSYLDCVYYSTVTFTTLGYGDISPSGQARPVAAVEAFFGAFMMALFVTVFGKNMTR